MGFNMCFMHVSTRLHAVVAESSNDGRSESTKHYVSKC
jgi:hypothetical protein